MKKYALIEIILAGVFWGTSAIFVHYLAPYGVSSLQMTFMRAFVSFAALSVYALIKDRTLFRVTRKEILFFAGSGIAFFGTAACYFISMQATSVSTAVVLMYTAPIFVMLFSVLFLGEKITPLKFCAVVSMLVGCGLVSGVIGGLKFDLVGILVGFCSGLFYSAYNIIVKIEMSKNSRPVTSTIYCFFFAMLIGFVLCEPLELVKITANDIKVLPIMLLLGVCTCILPYFLYTLALRVLPVGTTSALAIIEPMSATLFSVILFSEPLDIFSSCGIILILTSVFLLSKSDK